MPRATTPSFIVEMPLVTNSNERHTLDSRFEAGRQIYNACLGEAIRRHGQMMRSKIYQVAREMPSAVKDEIKARKEAFKQAREQYGFREYALHRYATEICRSWIAGNGEVIEFPPSPALSQICICGDKKKKKLSERWHRCDCGIIAQRDLFSVFLARHVLRDNPNWTCNTEATAKKWTILKRLLKQAVIMVRKSYPNKAPSSFGL